MTTRIDDMLPFESHVEIMQANLYNMWRRVRLHVNLPVRLELPELKSMRLILEEDSWVVVDSSHTDLPMIAWLKFQDNSRSSLHTPVECTMNYYHFMAHKYRERVLKSIAEAFDNCLE